MASVYLWDVIQPCRDCKFHLFLRVRRSQTCWAGWNSQQVELLALTSQTWAMQGLWLSRKREAFSLPLNNGTVAKNKKKQKTKTMQGFFSCNSVRPLQWRSASTEGYTDKMQGAPVKKWPRVNTLQHNAEPSTRTLFIPQHWQRRKLLSFCQSHSLTQRDAIWSLGIWGAFKLDFMGYISYILI